MNLFIIFHPPFLLILSFLFRYSSPSHSLDVITPTYPLKDGAVLVSSNATFALGFFSPSNSSRNRYVGIWYNKVSQRTVVWVANRDAPLKDASGILSINSHGNVVVCENSRPNGTVANPVWSSNVSLSSFPSPNYVTSAKLLETGNFVLMGDDGGGGSQKVLWQSFDHPGDTLLPFMKLGLDRRTGLNRFLTSWKSPVEPGLGNLTYRIDPTGFPQLFLYKNGYPLWRVGSWTGQRWSGVPEMTPNFIFNVSFVDDANEVSIMYGVKDPNVFSIMVVGDTGHVRRSTWQAHEHRWFQIWYGPKEDCDGFRRCGSNSNCNPYNADKFECVCLPGFEPKFPREWYLRDGSGGCVRKQNVSTCRSGEGFVKVARVKVPDTSKARVDRRLGLKGCKEKCLRDCSCVAYTSADERTQSGCLTWHADMEDIRTYTSVGQDLYVRVDAAELAKYAKKPYGSLGKKGMVALLVVSSGLIIFLVASFIYWFVKNQRKEKRRHSKSLLNYNFEGSPSIHDLDRGQNSDLPFFELSDVAAATDHFSNANKLGQGGFGSVYKLRILSDEEKRLLLNWRKRFDIICGVARGILYLHRDSRLRIIHRDLKASNVLLDSDLNPKIADFGMARIFGGDQIEANTNRVVGTYGYMSPEYAMKGFFSIKSDVYSFGVLLLEVVTGKKNNSDYDDITSTLVGHIWDLWNEGKAMEIVDPSIHETCPKDEVINCIQIGLLCVQDNAADRPTMSTVISMLGSDSSLPSPKQPAFISKRSTACDSSNPSTSEGINSVNDVSITMIEAR
ncbi:G-type lectin S-receptor-like serine/threonine-protein kinase [Senna tora]|uniref:Receptor-like serine/threonine-protein kinase n=1 Tax=Senna tora TaxID=362788 RepID=A0A834XF79_9FABA|nr:G-type lectin S-receptor-like serine/threonine-protein kinase [Senna tora]